jgi:hypothetical protein
MVCALSLTLMQRIFVGEEEHGLCLSPVLGL